MMKEQKGNLFLFTKEIGKKIVWMGFVLRSADNDKDVL